LEAEVIPIWIGYDTRERVAYHVLAESIINRSSESVAISPVGNVVTPHRYWWRLSGQHDSTQFSNARFIVPALMNYEGWAIFMDCDMVCLGDIDDLWSQRDDKYAVMCVKHRHVPTETTKFLGAEQSVYNKKNWSSLMLLNCGHPSAKRLTPEYVNNASGLDLHRFEWCDESEIGAISGLWNVLVAQGHQHPEPVTEPDIKLLHYTLGGPWHGHLPDGTELWMDAFRQMLTKSNPCGAATTFRVNPNKLGFSGSFTRCEP
jgi:lipopolysaccharide biosynthesis glycosyltransferase